ncbi:dTMP kinase [Vibrio parahaemolyticus]|uniref:Thymidylate kinase n=5 Tax=Vibrio TaxID=662 RepID=KTHY_VIBPA|nr:MULTISPECIES: dTMP kinase [Vibrio]Q87N26.1 RecName: Full=Thymidylate kinase; AltName: Full=dTMP kinase [Vibrio parahaemolyticus RIMD 2210633]EJG0765237.1 dTMP kinase [Vibrio parahaemolyticus O5:K30]EJG0921856.1 dTMP kinase [Vibrio parahaemolyticus O1:K68]EJG0931402.1 dTMP kinase [Vibrio parahaemolyticus O1]EJG0945683.1 dTMP kinase [Vibrio parahaemolyticus O10]EJG0949700.1 dTMP kinase [Vibrio parahaemolyticus O1:K58]ETZ09205.1 thymidylate kinase [Vibrio parahaemolyticus M0605]OOI06114.1 d
MMKANFIVVEGLEGAGKSTAIKTVLDTLKQAGIENIVNTREPGGTPLAEKMRALVKEEHEGEELKDMTELLLLYAARVQLVENVIKPALANGQWVVGDRHDLSSQAYQGGGRQIDASLMKNLRDTTLGDFKPAFTLYMDIDPRIGLERARGRGELDRIEKMDISFFERTRERYLEIANADPSIVVINAEQSIEEVSRDIQDALNEWLSRQ